MAIRVSQLAVEVISTIESNPVADVIQAAVEVATVRPVQTLTYAIVDQAAVEVALNIGAAPPPPPPPAGVEPVLSQGTHIRMSIDECIDVLASPLPPFVLLDCLSKTVSVTGGTSAETRVTTMCSTASEYRIGKTDHGSLSVEGFWKIGNAIHDAIKVAAADRKRRLLHVTFSDGSQWRCLAMVSQRSWSAAVDGIVGANYTFKLTGPAVEINPAPV